MSHKKKPIKTIKSKNKPFVSTQITNLEAFACLWLDANVKNTDDNRETEQELRQIINHLRIFDQADACEKLIRATKQEKIVLIVSGQLGRDVIPRLHNLPQLVACYVYCLNGTDHEEWTRTYSKVQGVFVERADLLKQIDLDQNNRLLTEQLSAIEIISGDSRALESRNAMFMWFQIFIEVLIRMHHNVNSKKEFIDICKKNYKENPKEFSIIKEFEESYKSDNAIYWYTRECCIYRILNKALRIQDFNMLFILRFFITDISKQLKQLQKSILRMTYKRDPFVVYRGQAMTMQFLLDANISEDIQRILFEININPREKTKAYADINEISYFKTEAEVLIMLGALFHIDSIEEKPDDNIWIAHLTLASDDDYQLKETLAYMKEKIGQETDLGTLAEILIQMGKYDQALKYSDRIMHESQMNTAKAYEIEAKALCLKGDYKTALDRSSQIMIIYNKILPSICAEKGQLYCAIGAVYYRQGSYDQALSNLNEALKIQRQVLPSNHPDICETYQHLADCYESKKRIKESLEYYNKCLQIRLTILPENHPAIALTYNNLGTMYENNENYQEALNYYQKSLNISYKSLPPTHPEVQRTEENIDRVKSLV
ncbi:unnamed protein product [Rotaria sp. Silwood1]|nr:unnamed protein product [Rotaria sp. Silwood1]